MGRGRGLGKGRENGGEGDNYMMVLGGVSENGEGNRRKIRGRE